MLNLIILFFNSKILLFLLMVSFFHLSIHSNIFILVSLGVSLMNNKNIDSFSSLSSGFVALQVFHSIFCSYSCQSNRTAVNLYKWGKAQPVFKCNLSEKVFSYSSSFSFPSSLLVVLHRMESIYSLEALVERCIPHSPFHNWFLVMCIPCLLASYCSPLKLTTRYIDL